MTNILISSDFSIYTNTHTLLVNNLGNIFIWMALIISCIIISIIAIIFLIKYSKHPKKWSHNSLLKQSYPGILNDLSDSIRSDKKFKQYKSEIDETILMMFFKKIEETKNIPTNELREMKKKDPHKLYEIIKDKDIISWMQKIENITRDKQERFVKTKKQKYVKEINVILNKMEEWKK
jgi:hypothetical protein